MHVILILLLPLAIAHSTLLAADNNHLVEGVVVDSQSGATLANVRVSLAPSKARGQKTEQVTRQDGRFSFPVSQPGKYTLGIAKPGYPPQDYKGFTLSGIESAIVVRDDQDTRHIVFEAKRGSAISGQAKDEDGEPASHALIAIFQSAIVGGERNVIPQGQTRANAAGEFRFRNLPSGYYYVCAMGRPWFADSLIQFQAMAEHPPVPRRRMASAGNEGPDSPSEQQPAPEEQVPPYSPDPGFRGTAFQTTFYPNAPSAEAASPVHVDVGAEMQVAITLPLARAVTVKGAVSGPGGMSGGRVFLTKKIYARYMLFLDVWLQPDGTFQLDNVPAGAYEIVAASQASSGPASWLTRQQLNVGTSDLEVQLTPPQMGSFSGRVLFDGEPSSDAGLFVSLQDEDEKDNLMRAKVSPDGSFSLSRLAAGRYRVTGGSADYLAAYLQGPAGERLPLTLEITPGATVHQNLVLTRAVSVIEGTVEKATVPQIGAFVLLLPRNPLQKWGYRMDQTDSDGSYSLKTIPAGDYSLIALSTGEGIAYRDPKVGTILTRTAQLVRVKGGDHLELKLEVVSTPALNLPSL